MAKSKQPPTDRASRATPANDNDRAVTDMAESISAAIMLAHGAPATMMLRLDPGRHLRLRIACAMRRQPAQALIQEALDAHLHGIDGIERLAGAVTEDGIAANLWGME